MQFYKSLRSVLLLAGAAFLLSSCGGDGKKETAPEKEAEAAHAETEEEVMLTEAQYKTAAIQTAPIEMKQISGTFKVNGMLDVPPQQQVSISVPLGGFLKKTELLQGMRVKKGQQIAVIENADYVQMQQDYLESKSQLEYAQLDFERQEALARENVNAQKTLQQAKSAYQTLQARVNALREKIRVSGISLAAVEKGNIQSVVILYSPINGFVTQVNANIGKFVNPTDVLFEIVDTEHLHAELTVFEKDVPKLKIGQRVRFTLANETKERLATVYLIGREIAEDRTVRIHCHISKEDVHLLPGMYLKAVVETGGSQVPALPSQAIVDYLGKKYIFLEAEERFHFKMVEIGAGNNDQGYTELILPDTLDAANARVVVQGAYDLLSKMKNSEGEGHAH